MGLPVVTVAAGGLPIVEATLGTPVTEAANGRGVPVTKVVGKPGLPVVFETIGVGPSAPAWTPVNLGAALRAWYKFDELTGANNDPKGSVTDASGNGFTLTQGNPADYPLLQVAEQNGLNTLRFYTGSGSHRHYIISNSVFSSLTAASCYLVYKIAVEDVNTGLLNLGTSGLESHWPQSGGIIYTDFGSTTRQVVGNPSVTLTAYRIVSMYSVVNDWAFYLDGGSGGSSGGTSAFFSTATNTIGWRGATIQFGRNPDGGIPLNGWIAEAVFTNAKQSTTDRQKMEGYLAWKWGLASNLSGGHPYKSAAP